MGSSFRTGGMGTGGPMHGADRAGRGLGRAISADMTAKRPKPRFRDIWPEIRELIRPRLWLLAGCFLLMIVNRASALVLPYSFKPLIDRIFTLHQMWLLPRIVGAVFGATLLQGITSYALTQLLSKSGQRLIADLRKQVQQHVGRLSVSFYDENRTGTLVARIMSDVEGVRNLIGTALVAFVIMGTFALVLQRAFKTIRPIFRERAKINAEVTGRLTESLGGVRVVKGYQ